MASPALSDEDFNRLQNQLIELRTQNYDLENKLKRVETENNNLNERNVSQEKEISKLQRLSKFPGFQAITKSKSKKDIAELMEENERLTQQMQRHEDDFKLQNQTLLGELSRLSNENEELQKKLESTTNSSGNDEENRRLLAENAVLLKTVEDLKGQHQSNSNDDSEETTNIEEIETQVDQLLDNVIQMFPHSLSEEEEEPNNYKETLKVYMENLKATLRTKTINNNTSASSTETNFRLETALQEKELLQNQLSTFKESSKQELKQLREEVSKWEEKSKKKQESYVKLQEEKERMFEEHRKAIEKLKEESLVHEKKGDQLEDLQGKLDISKAESQAMQSELIVLREKCKIDQSARINELEDEIIAFNKDKDNMSGEINNLRSELEHLRQAHEILTMEKEDLEKDFKQANELAENRKSLLDQTSVERQQDLETHQNRIEGLKKKYELDIQELITKNNEEIEDLKRQLTNNKKLKKELEDSKKEIETHKTTCDDLSNQITSVEEKCGWLERSLKESEETLKNLEEEKEKEIQELRQSSEKQIEELETKHSQDLKAKDEELRVIVAEKSEQETLVAKLTQAAKDREVEYRIANKKTDNLVKDLKRQLNGERKKADQLQSKLQDFIQEIKVKQTYDEIFNPESLQLKTAAAMSHRRTDSGSHLSVISSHSGIDNEDAGSGLKVRTSSPVESSSSLVGLSDETVDLISRLTDLQQEKWKLEERVKHLEENGAVMADDLMQKSLIIQSYVMENKADVSVQRQRNLTLKEKMIDKLKIGNNEELNREMNAKMQRMLEETLARNLQLEKDVDLLSKELDKASNQSVEDKK